jgi:hypothetical protein
LGREMEKREFLPHSERRHRRQECSRGESACWRASAGAQEEKKKKTCPPQRAAQKLLRLGLGLRLKLERLRAPAVPAQASASRASPSEQHFPSVPGTASLRALWGPFSAILGLGPFFSGPFSAILGLRPFFSGPFWAIRARCQSYCGQFSAMHSLPPLFSGQRHPAVFAVVVVVVVVVVWASRASFSGLGKHYSSGNQRQLLSGGPSPWAQSCSWATAVWAELPDSDSNSDSGPPAAARA